MKDNLVEGESCGLFGIIQLQRSNGNIHFSNHKRFQHVVASRQIKWIKQGLANHQVNSLIFSSNLKQILKEGDELRDTFEQDTNVFNRIKDFELGVYKNFSNP